MEEPIVYNASTGGSGNYTTFIDNVISKLSKSAVRFVRNRPVLPKKKTPIQYFHILLQGKDSHSLTLKLQVQDLYLVAFKTDGTTSTVANKWFRYDDFDIPGAESLHIKSNYDEYLGNITIGRTPLLEAITYLSTYNKDGKVKDHLQVLIVMISEAIRFNKISHDIIAKLFHDPIKGKNIQLGNNSDIFRKWEDISKDVLKCDAGKQFQFPSKTYASLGITTFEDAISALSVLKFVEKD